MHDPKNYKFFIEINTFKNQARVILNRLKGQQDPHIISAIKLTIDGKFDNSSPAEMAILDSLLNHPERYIKSMDDEVKKNIHAEIREILETFIRELGDEVICTKVSPRV